MVCVLNRSKAIHEQEMVAKGNELRRVSVCLHSLLIHPKRCFPAREYCEQPQEGADQRSGAPRAGSEGAAAGRRAADVSEKEYLQHQRVDLL